MDITWGPDHDQDDERCLATEAIAAGYDGQRPDEHFVLRVRPNGDRFAWMVDFHEDYVSAPYESVSSGEALGRPGAQRQAIRAMLDLIDAGSRPERAEYLSDEQIAAVMAAYAAIVKTNRAELAVAGLDGQHEIIDAEIVEEVLETAAHAGLHTGDIDADSYRRLTTAVTEYRQALVAANACSSPDEDACETVGHDH